MKVLPGEKRERGPPGDKLVKSGFIVLFQWFTILQSKVPVFQRAVQLVDAV